VILATMNLTFLPLPLIMGGFCEFEPYQGTCLH